MVEHKDILPLGYLKRSEYTGSNSGFRYRIRKMTEGDADRLECTVWPEPFNYVSTPEDQKQRDIFEFSNDGIEDAVRYINHIITGV